MPDFLAQYGGIVGYVLLLLAWLITMLHNRMLKRSYDEAINLANEAVRQRDEAREQVKALEEWVM